MKDIALLLFAASVSAILFGCQDEKETVKAEEQKSESEIIESEQLLSKNELIKVEISKTKGIDPVAYEEADVLVTFNDVFSHAIREPGTANATDPKFHLKITNQDGDIQRLYLWIGNKGEQSMLMNPKDTHTIYTVASDMTPKLIELIKK